MYVSQFSTYLKQSQWNAAAVRAFTSGDADPYRHIEYICGCEVLRLLTIRTCSTSLHTLYVLEESVVSSRRRRQIVDLYRDARGCVVQ